MNAYLGIDVSKGYSDFLLLDENFEKLEDAFQLDDTVRGHKTLEGWLDTQIKKHGISRVDAAVESTGGFENNWFSLVFRLSERMPVRISRLNPSVIKNAAKADLNVQSTDMISAKNIASYLIRYKEQVNYQEPNDQYRCFRTLQNHISLLTKQKTQMVNELKQILYSCFPELQRFCKQSIPNWVLELLSQYPTAKRLSRGKVSKVARIKGLSAEKAKQLIEKAKGSVGSKGMFTDEFLVESMAKDIRTKQKRIAELKKFLEENCKGAEVGLLQSITGIGGYSAACIMIQIENIARFASPTKLVGYFGLYPTIKESGDKKLVSRMSKKGRSAIRATLFMCANTAVLHDPHLKNIYAGQRAKGKTHKQAIGVVMHKMLRIIWGVLHHGTAYDREKDQALQVKNSHPVNTEKKEIEGKRRMQKFDEEAPISRIALKKRKAHQTSQVSFAEQVRDHNDVPEEQT